MPAATHPDHAAAMFAGIAATSQAVKAFKTAVRQWRIGRLIPSSFRQPKGRPPLR
ncbi:hypothetical protein [Pseudomonas sp. R3-52-08]|uniref:hypothetical protein n=1 Tax=Pseudomonas sp. R3-52-08 TaxID=1173284 RepID=UPI000F6D82FE|nr:hypothetical protein [Pseudomonas sp. R3-52-08]AZF20876.1 hypothetical protein C4J91_2126 [Pseudomonas sp. R3-52-08]